MNNLLFKFCIAGLILIFNSFGIHIPTKISSDVATVYFDSKYEVEINTNIIYGYGLSHDSFNFENPRQVPLKLDIYNPRNNFFNRPVMVLIHGGGFRNGSKEKLPFVEMSTFFASRGWVVFTINYRLMKDFGSVPNEWSQYINKIRIEKKKNQKKAAYPAIRDAKAAMRWIVANQERYGINTNYITVGGGSAGAVSALGVGLSDNEDYKNELTIEQDPTLLSTNPKINFNVKTILDFWGSKGSVDGINELYQKQLYNRNNPSLFIAHGTKDQIVSYKNAEDLRDIYEQTGAQYVLHPLEGKGHGPWGYNDLEGNSLGDLALKFIVKQQRLIVK